MAWDYSDKNVKRNRDATLASTAIKYWGMKPQLLGNDGKPVDRTPTFKSLDGAARVKQDRLTRNRQLVAEMKAGE